MGSQILKRTESINVTKRSRLGLCLIALMLGQATFQSSAQATSPEGPATKAIGPSSHRLPIPHLDTLPWMNWPSRAPGIKADFLLYPDAERPSLLLLPGDTRGVSPKVS